MGTPEVLSSPIIKEKIKNTILQRYGTDSVLSSPEIIEKIKKTNIERYGAENPMQNIEVQNKSTLGIFKKYGYNYPIQVPEIKEKIKQTNLEKYGKEYFQQIHIPDSTMIILKDKSLLQQSFEGKSLYSVSVQLGIDRTTFSKYWYGHDLAAFSNSSYEREIAAFLDTLGVRYEQNTRKQIGRLELDFYLPAYNLAIEFNGLYWHSSAVVDKNYHRVKYEACRDRGIRLLMINEDEWNDRNHAWRSRITHLLNKSSRGLPARKLVIRPITQTTMNDFCNLHHVQGKTTGTIYNIGAFAQDTLVGVMSFNKQRGTQDIELVRFCTDEFSHAGLFSRMFRRAVKDMGFDSVLSFADLRHSDGNVYQHNGFTLMAEIRPDYRYIFKGITFHKSAFTKKRIGQRFDLDMSLLTERQAMVKLGIPRIYDCGKLKFVWRK